MLLVKDNTVLIVIYIWRILKSPLLSLDRERHDTVRLSCRMIQSSGVAFIFPAQQTLWICGLLCILCSSDRLWILLRLGQINGHIESSILCFRCPFHILCNTVTADIIGIPAEFVIEIRCLLRRLAIQLPKLCDHHAWSRHQCPHKLCIKQIAVSHGIFLQNTIFICPVHNTAESAFQIRYRTGIIRLLILIQLQYLQNTVDGVHLILRHN